MKYTPEEVAELLKERPNQPHYIRALIGKCVRAAVLAEREACAKLCDESAIRLFSGKSRVNQVDRHTAEVLRRHAEAIRARSNP